MMDGKDNVRNAGGSAFLNMLFKHYLRVRVGACKGGMGCGTTCFNVTCGIGLNAIGCCWMVFAGATGWYVCLSARDYSSINTKSLYVVDPSKSQPLQFYFFLPYHMFPSYSY